jgi:DNA-directed RNA polymerase subunit RPC12/RpoP
MGKEEQSRFKCLRCGHEYVALFRKDLERVCPQCRSNSVRRLRGKVSQGSKTVAER